MHAKQADDGEVAKHTIKRTGAVVARNGHGVFVTFLRGQLLVDLRALDKRVEDVEDAVAAPCVGVLAQDLGFRLIGSGSGDSVAIPTEGLELVDEFVNHVPCPIILVRGLVEGIG